MKRASYREAVKWIAFNDDPGASDAYLSTEVAKLISVILVADLFGVEPLKVGADVVIQRHKWDREKEAEERDLRHRGVM